LNILFSGGNQDENASAIGEQLPAPDARDQAKRRATTTLLNFLRHVAETDDPDPAFSRE
jgi:hypothetical protein